MSCCDNKFKFLYTVAKLIEDDTVIGIKLERGNNNIQRGINLINQYLAYVGDHINPYTKEPGGSYMYFSDKLTFLTNEITGYKWKKSPWSYHLSSQGWRSQTFLSAD